MRRWPVRISSRGPPSTRSQRRRSPSLIQCSPETWKRSGTPRAGPGLEPRTAAPGSLGPHRDLGGSLHRELVGAVPVGVAQQEEAVADQGLLPVAARAAQRQQALLDDVLAVAVQELGEAVDPGD